MTSGSYSLEGSFRAFLSVLQAPGALTLCISPANNPLTMFWQNVSGRTLQGNKNLANTDGWSVNSNWTTSDGTNYLNLTLPAENLPFRLSNPLRKHNFPGQG